MEIYTLDRGFVKQETIDTFESAIWTERYWGNGDFKIVVPANSSMVSLLPRGQLMMCEGSDQPMILETRDIKNGLMGTTGITLAQWLNNRIIKTAADPDVKEWLVEGKHPGEIISLIAQKMCMASEYTNGTVPIGIPTAFTNLWPVPGLVLGAVDVSGPVISMSIPFGPVYDPMKEIATSYDIGIKIVIQNATEAGFTIAFVTYSGKDRTSDQNVNPVVQFSPEMDSFTDVSDLESISEHRNSVHAFATNQTNLLLGTRGHASSVDDYLPLGEPGFDLRVTVLYADGIDPLAVSNDGPRLLELLNQKAKNELTDRKVVQLVDGQIVESEDVKYGKSFFLGDIVEVKGNTGVLQKARITEYIRSQDKAGEREYPTLSMID